MCPQLSLLGYTNNVKIQTKLISKRAKHEFNVKLFSKSAVGNTRGDTHGAMSGKGYIEEAVTYTIGFTAPINRLINKVCVIALE